MATNAEMFGMLQSLEPVLECSGMVGYAAARNTRLLRQACAEYLAKQEELVNELGEPEMDGNGLPTGRVVITPASPNFGEFIESLGRYADIEHDFEPFRIPIGEAIGMLTGTQMLSLDWMLED